MPRVDRLGADTQSLGHVAHRIAPILDLGHRIALELICEFSSGNIVLLASKITKQGVYKSRGYSGVPSLAIQIHKEEQLSRLLEPVRFEGINLSSTADKEELVHLVFSYCDKARLVFDDFEMEDFLARLTFAGCQRWGLVIEMLIEL